MYTKRIKRNKKEIMQALPCVHSNLGAGQLDTLSRESMPTRPPPNKLPCNCLGIIIFSGLFIVHRVVPANQDPVSVL